MKEKLKSGNIKGGAHTAIVTKRSGEAPVKKTAVPAKKGSHDTGPGGSSVLVGGLA
jgi:hypothetical protein